MRLKEFIGLTNDQVIIKLETERNLLNANLRKCSRCGDYNKKRIRFLKAEIKIRGIPER